MKKNRGCLTGLLILAGVVIVVCFLLGLPAGFQAIRLLDRELERDRLGGTISLRSEEQTMEAEFYWCELGDERYWCLRAQGMDLYYHDEVISFDNGRGYDLSAVLEQLSMPDGDDWKWLMLAGFRKEGTSNATSYILTLDKLRLELLSSLNPEHRPRLSGLEGATLRIDSRDGTLTGLTISAMGYELQMIPENRNSVVPPEVLLGMESGKPADVRSLVPLLRACGELAEADAAGADMTLELECGPLPIRDTAQVWGTTDGLYFIRGGKTIDLTPQGLSTTAELFWGLSIALCREGTIENTGDGDCLVTLSVEAEDLEEMIDTLLPELEGLNVELEDGAMVFTIQDHRLTAMELTCSGHMPFLVTTIPLGLHVSLDRMEGTVTLPEGIG